MKKVLVTLSMLTLCVSLLVGCSKTENLKWNNGQLVVGKSVCEVSSYNGSSMRIDTPNYSATISYCCDDIYNCTHNIKNVAIENMTKIKKGYYYSMYYDTKYFIFAPNPNGGWNEARVDVKSGSSMPLSDIETKLYPIANALLFNNTVGTVTINDKVTLTTKDLPFDIRNNCVMVKGYMMLGTDTGTVAFTEKKEIKGKSVDFKTTGKYDYYRYGDVIIQATAGLDISVYLKFK